MISTRLIYCCWLLKVWSRHLSGRPRHGTQAPYASVALPGSALHGLKPHPLFFSVRVLRNSVDGSL